VYQNFNICSVYKLQALQSNTFFGDNDFDWCWEVLLFRG
jgi:hypothetical protein